MADPIRINLGESINTDSPDMDVRPLNPEVGPAPHIKMTGIERNGGIKNLYQTVAAKTGTSYVQYTKSGKRVELTVGATYSDVTIDGVFIKRLGYCYGVEYNVEFPYEAVDLIASPVANQFDVLRQLPPVAQLGYWLQRWAYAPSTGLWTKINEIEVAIGNNYNVNFSIVRGSVDYATVANNQFVAQHATTFDLARVDGAATTLNTLTGFTDYGIFNAWKISTDADFVVSRMDSPWTYISATATTLSGYGYAINSQDNKKVDVFKMPTVGDTVIGKHITISSGAVIDTTVSEILSIYDAFVTLGGGFVSYSHAGGDASKTFAAAPGMGNTLKSYCTEGAHICYSGFGFAKQYIYTVNRKASYLGGVTGLISEVGDLDNNYSPSSFNTIASSVYRSVSGKYKCYGVSMAFDTILQLLDDEIVLINTTTCQNIIDVVGRRMDYGPLASNNGIVIAVPYASPGVPLTIAARHEFGKYCQSVDTGEKTIINVGTLLAGRYWASGVFIDFVENINIYENSIYTTTLVRGDYPQYPVMNKSNMDGVVYVQDLTIPIPCASIIKEGSANIFNKTFLREKERIAYQLGNELPFAATGFDLFGLRYVFDGDTIHLLTVDNGGALIAYEKAALADGLSFLAVTPTEAWFLSAYDNSLWTFNGGKNVEKKIRLNAKSAITAAAFSVASNELALLSGSGAVVVYIRDGVISETTLGATGTGTRTLQPTSSGIWLVVQGGAGNMAKTHFANLAGSAVVPLDFQSAYQGAEYNTKLTFGEYVFTLYDAAKTAGTVQLDWNAFDEGGPRTVETKTVTLTWKSDGTCRVSFIPTAGYVIGASIRLYSTLPITILDAFHKIGDSSAWATVELRGV